MGSTATGTFAKIDDLLRFTAKQEASDLHLKPMRPPLIRLKGKLLPLKSEPLPPDKLNEMVGSLLTDKMKKTLEDELAVDFGYSLPGVCRFRGAVFYQRGHLGAVFRRVPFQFPSLDEWGLPPVLNTFADLPQGLVLITGPTGSGKSSTLAALMKLISDTRLSHIITIEDPIEFLLKDAKGAVSQREVGTDTPSFSHALRNALRQDPDVIMVGEMRDRDTMQTVLTAAETGHLVFSTLHTNSAAQTIDRIIDAFPAESHRQIRQQLSSVLQAVVCHSLVERADGSGLVAALEILRHTPRVSKLIVEGNLDGLNEEIESSVSYHKMQSMNQSLAALVVHGQITRETALNASNNAADLDLFLRKLAFGGQTGGEDSSMAEPYSDYSKILELQEIKKAYDELQDTHRNQMAEREAEMDRLRTELREASGAGMAQQAVVDEGEVSELRAENDRYKKQLQVIRQEYDAKIERLNARIRDLSGAGTGGATRQAPATESGAERRGFFRR